MILVYVEFTVAPENLSLALDELSSEREQVRALTGNLAFDVAPDPGHLGRVRLFHEWDDRDAFASYRKSDIFKATGQRLFPLMVEPPKSRVFIPAPAAD